jgi:hypothetical protein
MGRQKKLFGGSEKAKKRKKVTVQLLKRSHAGKVTEPYEIMEELIERDRSDLADVKIAIAWRVGWRADANGLLTLGRCRKRGDLDRELDEFDFIVLLNKEAWQTLDETQKKALIFHELCHAQVVIDADGNPKQDDRDRLVCRIRKHDVEEFRAVTDKFGLWTQDLARLVQANINDAARPLLAEKPPATEDKTGGNGEFTDSQKRTKLALILNPRHAELLEKSRHAVTTTEQLQQLMTRFGGFWNQDIHGIGAAAKEKIEDAYNAWVMATTGAG